MPSVSVIVPCYNEEQTICLLLNAIYTQTYPRAELEVVIADGQSTDRTRARIEEFKIDHPDIQIDIVDNPKRSIPSGLNRAIASARGEYIVRMDAHSVPTPDYIERCLKALQSGSGDNVGGVWQIEPGNDSWMARSIASAASHPLGVGDAAYRVGGNPNSVDTVPFGAFRRILVDRVGYFDESLLTNEDYEFNTRIRQTGGKIWFDPQIRSIYFARTDLAALARQYFRYGYWKAQMLRRYPQTLRWRQLLPPLFVACLGLLMVLSPWTEIARWLLLIQAAIYGITLLGVGIQVSLKNRDPFMIIGVPLAITTMHNAWGCALLLGLIRKSQVKRYEEKT